jgi:membrane associated rhomboid family serine protease
MNFNSHRPSSFNFLPTVVKNLLIINGLFFLATYVFGIQFGTDLNSILGMHYPGSDDFRIYQLISYMFMHGNLSHIFFNMFAVWMFGSVLENFWGPKRFLIFYLLTGIGAAITHYTVLYFTDLKPVTDLIEAYIANPDIDYYMTLIQSEEFKGLIASPHQEIRNSYLDYNQQIYNLIQENNTKEAITLSTEYLTIFKAQFLNLPVVVGASGSLYGLLLAYGVLFPNAIIYLYFALPIKAKYFVILYGLLELYSGFSGSSSNIAHFAHLGGMVFGFILIKLWRKQNFNDY